MNRRGAAVFREKRGMDIEAVFRDLEQAAWNEFSVRSHDKDVRAKIEQFPGDFGIAQRRIFGDGKFFSLTIIKDLTRFKFEAASFFFWRAWSRPVRVPYRNAGRLREL